MIEIDGSTGEGGGQMVRTALALSMITQQPFSITNIRSGRKDPGLKAQHVHAITALQKLSGAKAEGAEIGSTKITFYPAPINKTRVDIDIGTAGSITLLLQSLLIPCAFAPKPVSLRITGGTDVTWSMPIDYLRHVFLPRISQWVDIDVKLSKRGYYPKGGGHVELRVKPKMSITDYPDINAFIEACHEAPSMQILNQGKIEVIKGVSNASQSLQDAKVAERQAESAQTALQSVGTSVHIQTEYSQSLSPGSGITVWVVLSEKDEEISRLGADALGERGKPAETVGKEAADQLIAAINSSAPIDAHLADNLIPWIGLFRPSSIHVESISNHTKTNITVVEQFLGTIFTIDEEKRIISSK